MRHRLTLLAAVVFAASLAGAGMAHAHPAPQAPVAEDGEATQVIVVVADNPGDTTAELTAAERGPDGWKTVIGPLKAYVGASGIGQASEGSKFTPAGRWSLTEAFGISENNGTRLPYRQVGTSDWWVSDPNSSLYNTYQHCDKGNCPFNEAAGENLGDVGHLYDHSVVIDYNRSPVVPGAGSAFFLHISGGGPTLGCVAVPERDLDAIMQWLDPAQNPVIDIHIIG